MNSGGYRISVVNIKQPNSYKVFISGWKINNNSQNIIWGRPTDIEFLSDGSMLISDDLVI
jgi:hypothetical protein